MSKEKLETTFGELMDIANQDDDIELKNFLRDTFKKWCVDNNKELFIVDTAEEFRAIHVTMKPNDTEEWKVEWQ